MPEWWHTLWSYRLHDLLMFSPRAHARLFELVNAQTWPLVLVTACLPLAVGVAVQRATARALAAAALLIALALALVAQWHLRRSLAGILWIAPGWAAAFGLASLAWLAWCAVQWRSARPAAIGASAIAGPQPPAASRAARALSGLLATLALAWPLLAPLQGRPWLQAEVAGLTPEPTALLALALLAVVRPTRAWVWWGLAAVPLAWCLFAGLLLLALQAPQAGLPPLAAAAVVALRVWGAPADKAMAQ